MTTTDPNPPIGDEDQAVTPAEFIDGLAAMAAASGGGDPAPLAAGTFVAYPMPDGGLMFVTNVEHGPFAGQKHHRIPPGMIRAVAVLSNGGGKLAALKALTGRKNRGE